MRDENEKVILFLEQIGLYVLVHRETERNDTVEYFGQLFEEYVFTENR
jgi:5-methyltetrahydropteroyltriglutamate--homocysteine methyltransferase